jgi:hypothetical protein
MNFSVHDLTMNESGFMTVDAMIGIAIFLLSLTLCLSALQIARHSGETARHAQGIVQRLS